MTEAQQAAERERITSAIHAYLAVLKGGSSLYELARALDRLVMTYHETTSVGPDTQDLPPNIDDGPYAEAASKAFPDLDIYALVEPDGGPDQQTGMSIAASDLGEIASDLLEVVWLFDNASYNDAVWQFRWGYQFHWGKHLHEIRTYLHCLAAW